jgi:hypothetical protein
MNKQLILKTDIYDLDQRELTYGPGLKKVNGLGKSQV